MFIILSFPIPNYSNPLERDENKQVLLLGITRIETQQRSPKQYKKSNKFFSCKWVAFKDPESARSSVYRRRKSNSIVSKTIKENEIGQKSSKSQIAVQTNTANERNTIEKWNNRSPTSPNFLDKDLNDSEQNLTNNSTETLTPSTSDKLLTGCQLDSINNRLPKKQNLWAHHPSVHGPKDYLAKSRKLSKKKKITTTKRLSACIPKCTTRNDSCEPESKTPSVRSSNNILSHRNNPYLNNNWYNGQEMDRSVDSIGSCSLDVDAESTDFSGSV